MTHFEDARAGEWQRHRGMRPNAHLYIRHDAWRFMPPGSPRYVGRDVVKYFEPALRERSQASERTDSAEGLELERQELLELKSYLVALRAEIRFQRLLRALKAYNPNQPRVPAGNPDGGEWTSEGRGGSSGVRLAAAGDKPRIGASAIAALAAEAAKRLIEAFRKDKACWICLAAGLAPSPTPSLMANRYLVQILPRRHIHVATVTQP